jgi:ribose transport system permease protein
MFTLYISNHQAGLTANVATTAANKGVLFALVAMAQTLPVLTGGLDLSVGMAFVLTNCVASSIVQGTPLETALGVVGVLAVGLLCGLLNGIIIVYGRLQPIITTLATGAFYYGIALSIRPTPGGDINPDFADALTGQLPGGVPAVLALLLLVVLVVWVPWRRSVLGRAAYAIGSSEQAAYMSGVPIDRAKLLAYALSGLLASIAGLLLTCITYAGEASAPIGGGYTLNSIAAVVIGGTSLQGGKGSIVGTVIGALIMAVLTNGLRIISVPQEWQSVAVGIVILVAVYLDMLRRRRT